MAVGDGPDAGNAPPAGKGSRTAVAYMFGAPRSGTTWVQRAMAAHPAVASGQETDLLNRYLRALQHAWAEDLPQDPLRWANTRHKGLPAVWTTAQFHGLLSRFADEVHTTILGLKPGARLVLDKNPSYAHMTELIARIDPTAPVVHVIRDGRDVVSSLLAASRSWGASWAPSDIPTAARFWAEHVHAGRQAAGRGQPYHEVRYEQLHTDGAATLQAGLAFVGITTDLPCCAKLLADQHPHSRPAGVMPDPLVWSGEVAARLGGAPPEPAGFYGPAKNGSWASTWSTADRQQFHDAAGDLLHHLGYETDDRWLG